LQKVHSALTKGLRPSKFAPRAHLRMVGED
jgi:hypothetical protein